MKYFAALALLAVPLALSAAPTPAEAAVGGLKCHWVKKTVWSHGKKRVRFVKQCRRVPVFKKKHHTRHDYRHHDRRR